MSASTPDGTDYGSGDALGAEPGTVREAVGRATSRIEEIIDSAERVAGEIRQEAETEATALLEARRREGDELVRQAEQLKQDTERARREREEAVAGAASGLGSDLADLRQSLERALDSLARTEQLIGDLRNSAGSPGAVPEVTPFTAPEPEAAPEPPAAEEDESEPYPSSWGTGNSESAGSGFTPPATFSPEPSAPEQEQPPAFDPPAYQAGDEVAAATGDEAVEPEPEPEPAAPAPSSDEAMLRATQMAVAGSSRDEIGRTLEAEFGIADPEQILDQILGPA